MTMILNQLRGDPKTYITPVVVNIARLVPTIQTKKM